MIGKRILFISSGVVPYLPQNNVSNSTFHIPKVVNERGGQTRIFIPKYGIINERRHQLHEVIRLSGMNLVIDDLDMPLIIKVASIPKERMQVYFIDNEDYFKGRGLFSDKNNKLYDDNQERAIFFAKGVIETIKKLNWIPDLIHVHGWIASLIPLYCKQYYKNDPLLSQTKIITSFYEPPFKKNMVGDFISKIKFDGIDDTFITDLNPPSLDSLFCNAAKYSDAIIKSSEMISDNLKAFFNSIKKPSLDLTLTENPIDAQIDLYESMF